MISHNIGFLEVQKSVTEHFYQRKGTEKNCLVDFVLSLFFFKGRSRVFFTFAKKFFFFLICG